MSTFRFTPAPLDTARVLGVLKRNGYRSIYRNGTYIIRGSDFRCVFTLHSCSVTGSVQAACEMFALAGITLVQNGGAL